MLKIKDEVEGITYTLVRKSVKNLNLRVRSDGSVTVSASPKVSVQRISAFVQSKSQFIRSAQEKFSEVEELKPQPKAYVSGESFRILGRDLRLKVVEGQPQRVESDGVYLTLTVKDTGDVKVKERLIKGYLTQRCRALFLELSQEAYQKFHKYGIAMPEVRQREMKTRWGSCLTTKGVITLNTKLLEMPRNCIEYVVLHEFCHFIYPNHSLNFYTLLATFMPDWKDCKAELERCGREV